MKKYYAKKATKTKKGSSLWLVVLLIFFLFLFIFISKKVYENKKEIERERIEFLRLKREKLELLSDKGKDYYLNDGVVVIVDIPEEYTIIVDRYGKEISCSVDGNYYFIWGNDGYHGPDNAHRCWIKKSKTDGKITVWLKKIKY